MEREQKPHDWEKEPKGRLLPPATVAACLDSSCVVPRGAMFFAMLYIITHYDHAMLNVFDFKLIRRVHFPTLSARRDQG